MALEKQLEEQKARLQTEICRIDARLENHSEVIESRTNILKVHDSRLASLGLLIEEQRQVINEFEWHIKGLKKHSQVVDLHLECFLPF